MIKQWIPALLLSTSHLLAGESITSIDSPYRTMCWKAATNPYFFQNFRSLSEFSHAMELTEGGAFANYLLSQASPPIMSRLNDFRKLESFGNPRRTNYPKLGSFSATTLRYIAVADELGKLFTLPKNPKIVEIGSGFGGECYILSQLIQWSKYYSYDLPEPTALLEKMMKALNVENVVCLRTFEDLPEDKVDLLISNYAFSECDKETQMDYLERIVVKADRGYMICNQTSEIYGIQSLSPHELIQLLDERGMHPQIYDELVPTFQGNLLIVWDIHK